MFDTPLSDRVARLEEARKAAVAAHETAIEAFSDLEKINRDGLDYALAQIEEILILQGF